MMREKKRGIKERKEREKGNSRERKERERKKDDYTASTTRVNFHNRLSLLQSAQNRNIINERKKNVKRKKMMFQQVRMSF